MAHVQARNKGTSSTDLADKSQGYAANGMSLYSRSHAQPHMAPSPTERDASKCDLLIRRNMHELRKLERKIAIESDPKTAGRLAGQHEIKMNFIAKLRREQIAGMARDERS